MPIRPVNRGSGLPVPPGKESKGRQPTKKFSVPSDPLQIEFKTNDITPHVQDFYEQLEHAIGTLDEGSFGSEFRRLPDADDVVDVVKEELWKLYAKDIYENIKQKIREKAAADFRCWLATRYRRYMPKITVTTTVDAEGNLRRAWAYQEGDPLPEGQVGPLPKVASDYLRAYVKKAYDYVQKLTDLSERRLVTLNDYYLYWKFIAKGRPIQSTDDELVYNEIDLSFLDHFKDKYDIDGRQVPSEMNQEIVDNCGEAQREKEEFQEAQAAAQGYNEEATAQEDTPAVKEAEKVVTPGNTAPEKEEDEKVDDFDNGDLQTATEGEDDDEDAFELPTEDDDDQTETVGPATDDDDDDEDTQEETPPPPDEPMADEPEPTLPVQQQQPKETDKVKQLQQELDSSREETAAMQNDLQRFTQEMRRLAQERNQLKQDLQKESKSKEELAADAAKVKSELKQLETERKQLTEKLAETEKIRTQLEKEMTQAKEEMKQVPQPSDQMKPVVSDINNLAKRVGLKELPEDASPKDLSGFVSLMIKKLEKDVEEGKQQTEVQRQNTQRLKEKLKSTKEEMESLKRSVPSEKEFDEAAKTKIAEERLKMKKQLEDFEERNKAQNRDWEAMLRKNTELTKEAEATRAALREAQKELQAEKKKKEMPRTPTPPPTRKGTAPATFVPTAKKKVTKSSAGQTEESSLGKMKVAAALEEAAENQRQAKQAAAQRKAAVQQQRRQASVPSRLMRKRTGVPSFASVQRAEDTIPLTKGDAEMDFILKRQDGTLKPGKYRLTIRKGKRSVQRLKTDKDIIEE